MNELLKPEKQSKRSIDSMKIKVWYVIGVLILCVGIYFAVSGSFLLGSDFVLFKTSISPDATLGYFGSIVTAVTSLYVAIAAVNISNKANEINREVLKQNEDICSDNTEKAVQPHISLCVIPSHQSIQGNVLSPLIPYTSPKPEEGVRYIEQDPNVYSAIVMEDGIQFYYGIHECVERYKHTMFDVKKETFETGTKCEFFRKKDRYVHIVIHNVGCGAALASEIAIQKIGDAEHSKSLYTRDLRPETDQAHIHLYMDAKVPVNDKYEIIVTYSNLYGKKYQQRYPFDKEYIALQSERTTLAGG